MSSSQAARWLAVAMGLLAVVGFAIDAGPGGEASTDEGTVWVFLVDGGGVEAAKRALGDRGYGESPGALALSQNRIVARDHDATSRLLNRLRCQDRPLELWSPARTGGVPGASQGPSDDPSETISELAGKKILSPGEAMRLVRALQATS